MSVDHSEWMIGLAAPCAATTLVTCIYIYIYACIELGRLWVYMYHLKGNNECHSLAKYLEPKVAFIVTSFPSQPDPKSRP